MSSRRIVVAHFGIAIVLAALAVLHVYLQNNLGALGMVMILVGSLMIGGGRYKRAIAKELASSPARDMAHQTTLNPVEGEPSKVNDKFSEEEASVIEDEFSRKMMLALIGTDMGVQEPADELAEYLAQLDPTKSLLNHCMEKDRHGHWRVRMVKTKGPVAITYTRPGN